jgi:hypothetical protein
MGKGKGRRLKRGLLSWLPLPFGFVIPIGDLDQQAAEDDKPLCSPIGMNLVTEMFGAGLAMRWPAWPGLPAVGPRCSRSVSNG